jgi:hypothetical protein
LKPPSHGTVIAYLALLIALGGTSYAAVKLDGSKLEKKSVTGRAIKPNSVKGNRLKTNTVAGKQINEATLACALIPGCGGGSAGDQGLQGPPGPPGAPGTPGQLIDSVITAATGPATYSGFPILANWTTQISTGSGFNAASGLFTVPVTGKYLLSVSSNQTMPASATSNSSITPVLQLRRSSGTTGAVIAQASFPVLNVNVPAVLSLQTPTIGEATITGIYQFNAGDVVSFALGSPAANAQYDGNLTIAELATG